MTASLRHQKTRKPGHHRSAPYWCYEAPFLDRPGSTWAHEINRVVVIGPLRLSAWRKDLRGDVIGSTPTGHEWTMSVAWHLANGLNTHLAAIDNDATVAMCQAVAMLGGHPSQDYYQEGDILA